MAKPCKSKRQNKSRSTKAGLEFPVGRIHRVMKKRNYVQRVSGHAPVYMAAVLEFLATELLELASCAVKKNKKSQIVPKDIQDVIRKDKELKKLLSGVTANRDVQSNGSSELKPKKSKKCSRKC